MPLEAIRHAYAETKQRLMQEVNRQLNAGFDHDLFTIGFARRATASKRPTLLVYDLERLRRIARQHGPLPLIFAGKAHPRDEAGKALIQQIVQGDSGEGPPTSPLNPKITARTDETEDQKILRVALGPVMAALSSSRVA